MKIAALILGFIGCAIAVASALSALFIVGGNPLYQIRLWAGVGALVLPLLAGIAAIFLAKRPLVACSIMLCCGVLGFLCINLFYINTWYFLALIAWLVALVLALLSNSIVSNRTFTNTDNR